MFKSDLFFETLLYNAIMIKTNLNIINRFFAYNILF